MTLDRIAEALRPYLIESQREHLRHLLMPPFGTAEARARVDAQVDRMTDEQIAAFWTRMAEEDARRCPECGRAYEHLEPWPRYQPARSSSGA